MWSSMEDLAYKIDELTEKKNDYTSRGLWSDTYKWYTPLGIACVVLGVIGNSFFCFFFGNTKKKVYNTRDALYFRRLSTLDLLVCLIVLPYSIVFEARYIKSRIVCKSMEFVRHVIVYMTHMLLPVYSAELPRRTSYHKVRKTVNRASLLIFLMSVVFATPSLLFFDMQAVYLGRNETVVYSTQVCQMTILLGRVEPLDTYLNIVKTVYVFAFCVSYICTFVFFVFKTMHYFDYRALPGRRSVGVQLTERVSMRSSLQEGWKHRRWRHSQTGQMIILAEYEQPGRPLTSSTDLAMSSPMLLHHSGQVASDLTVAPPASDISSDFSVKSKKNKFKAARARANSVDIAKRKKMQAKLRNDAGTPSVSGTVSPSFIDSKSDYSKVSPRKTPELPSDAEVAKSAGCLFSKDSSRQPSTSVSKESKLWLKGRKTPQSTISIMKGASSEKLKIESYKTPLMLLLMLDFLVVVVALVTFLMLEEESVILNLVHVKSVFSFYLIYLTKSSLRVAVHREMKGSKCRKARGVEP